MDLLWVPEFQDAPFFSKFLNFFPGMRRVESPWVGETNWFQTVCLRAYQTTNILSVLKYVQGHQPYIISQLKYQSTKPLDIINH